MSVEPVVYGSFRAHGMTFLVSGYPEGWNLLVDEVRDGERVFVAEVANRDTLNPAIRPHGPMTTWAKEQCLDFLDEVMKSYRASSFYVTPDGYAPHS